MKSDQLSTPFIKQMDSLLKKGKPNGYRVIDLFAGCGGLALGFEAAGFETIGYEQNYDCCVTYEKNLGSPCHQLVLTTETQFESADVVIGGPPCQPFSVSGQQLGILDSRDGFPSFIVAIQKIKPKIWVFENVRGLLYKNKWYLEKVIEALSQLGYQIDIKLLNASDYGVPQNRERLIVVGHLSKFEFPERVKTKTTAGDALGGYFEYEPDDGRYLNKSMDRYVKNYEIASNCVTPRDLHKHKPSRTVTCRNLAGATGDMLRIALPSGRRRRLLPREAARLQTFPDWFSFHGTELSVFNQIGNAVPPLFSFHLAKSILSTIENSRSLAVSKRGQKSPIQEHWLAPASLPTFLCYRHLFDEGETSADVCQGVGAFGRHHRPHR